MEKIIVFRKPHRLKEYDYSAPGSYMLTFNTKDKNIPLSSVIPQGMFSPPIVELTKYGKIVEKYISRLPQVYNVDLDNYVIMPDHVHVLLTIKPTDKQGKRTGVDTMIRSTKTLISKEIGFSIWQLDFYDVVIETEKEFRIYDQYIDDNPAAWIDRGKESHLR